MSPEPGPPLRLCPSEAQELRVPAMREPVLPEGASKGTYEEAAPHRRAQ